MKLTPILTEKSLSDAREGKFTFLVGKTLTKYQIKELVEFTFQVKVDSVKTVKLQGELKKSWSGRKKQVKPAKKAIVTLKGKDKIDLFDEGKK